jgi:acyl-CoA reductase-like NAD-dependent aldehyde dehydrogenase
VDWSSALRPYRESIVGNCAATSRVGPNGAHALWADLERFLAGAEQLAASLAERAELADRQVSAISGTARLKRLPLGRVLFVVPSNAALPLAFIVPLSLLATGNEVVVAAPRAVRTLVTSLLRPLQEHLGDRLRLAGGVRETLDELVDQRRVDAVYFTGSSDHYEAVAARCAAAGVELIYEGSGNAVSVVDEGLPDEALDQVAADVARSLVFANGLVCTSPNVLAVHERDVRRLRERLIRAYRAAPPSVPAVELVPHLAALQDAAPESWLPEVRSLDDGQTHELFGPATFITAYSTWTDLVGQLRRYAYRLQVTLYSQDDERWQELQRVTGFARYCRNMPSTDQDPLLPWGNFGLSGSSAVQDFLDKGLRTALIEEHSL